MSNLVLVTGTPGSGKSLYTLTTVKRLAERDNSPVYYHNIPDLALQWNHLEDPKRWFECPPGSIVVIDEAQNWFGVGSPAVRPEEHITNLEVVRQKFSIRLYLITQHPMFLHTNVRRCTTKHFHVERFYGFPKATIHEFQKTRDNCDKSTKNSIEHHFIYPKEAYEWYKSADAHTVKFQLPMRLILIVLLPIVLIALLYYGYSNVTSLADHPDEKPLLTESKPAQFSNVATRQQYTYLESRIPRVAALPETAPIYDELTKPKQAPYPAACVVIRDKCTCYSQQATKLLTDDATCRQIVTNGYFIDFQDPKDLMPNPAPRPTQQSELQTDSPKGRTVAPAPVGVAQVPAPGQVRSPSESMSAADSLNYNTVGSGNGV
jgi:zona occludens toxin